MSEKRLFKEYQQLSKTPASANNVQILDLRPLNAEDSIHIWQATIAKPSKQDSAYCNGKWTLEIDAGAQYPRKPPKIQFSRKTRINHPNIDFETGEICLDILKDDSWSPAWDLQHLVGAILMLLDEPEPDSPLNVDLANLFRSDTLAFVSLVQYTMWKEKTLYSVYEDGKNASGVKASEALEAESNGDNTSNVFSVKNGEVTDPQKDDLECPRDMGCHTTQEFLKKATEVQTLGPHDRQQHSSSSSSFSSSTSASHQPAAVYERVFNNVAKPIKEICLKNSSRAHSPTDEMPERQADVKSAEKSFMEKIDHQVVEIRRLQAPQTLN